MIKEKRRADGRLMDQNGFVEFLMQAKRKTYAGKGAETAPSRPKSHDLAYRENDLEYRDTYLGGKCFTGEEAVWRGGVPLWAMNYSGRVTDGSFNGDFLKAALRNVPAEMPFRGPSRFEDGDYLYLCKTGGSLEWFQGYEEIRYHGKKIYECFFHGGKVK